MTNYIVDREKLKEILLAHKTFISQRCQKLIAEGVDISKLTYGDTKKFTDEFIDTMIDKLRHFLMEFDEALEKAVHGIRSNHNKIIDDWCKAYMAQRYKEGKSIDIGSFTLCQQHLSWAQNVVGFKYWFEDGTPKFDDGKN